MSESLATFEVVTLFPEMFRSVLEGSLLGKAIERGLVAVHFTDPREWGLGKHRAVDDAPYGGGGGMVMRADSLVSAIEHAQSQRGPAHKVLLGPGGARLDRAAVVRLSALPRVLLVCGRYEGIDDRVNAFVDEELSLGDFVMTGGEIAAMAIIDACARRLPGVLGNQSSPLAESFEEALLEHPHFTRPPEFRGARVPEILGSGDHEKVRRYRRHESLLRTRDRRPDLFARHPLTNEDRELLKQPAAKQPATNDPRRALAARTHVALCHHPVLDRAGAVITTAITNLDIHDLARSTRTYDLAALHLITPVEAQRALCESILHGWRVEGSTRNDYRMEALARVSVSPSIESTISALATRTGQPPIVVATSARSGARVTAYDELIRQALTSEFSSRPLLILFGTGWGLADEVLDRVDRVLAPIQGAANYNHLSVRSAAAITLDRLFGERTSQ